MKCPVIDISNKKVGDIDLDEAIFGAPARPDILSRAVNWQLAKRQAGTHKTKQRAEVTGSTAKPFNQKGTGRARQGDKKAPHHRSGGVAFGPKPRSYTQKVNGKVRKLALTRALVDLASEGSISLIEDWSVKSHKTKDFAGLLKTIGSVSKTLIIDESFDKNLSLAARNLPKIKLSKAIDVNALDLVGTMQVVASLQGINSLIAKISNSQSDNS